MMKKLILMICCLPMVLAAEIFDDPQNLKVLDKDTSPLELRNTMKMFSQSLGVRCQHCHVGEEGQPLSEFDFASDEKATKEKARFMYKMVKDLNQHMVTGIKDRSVQVECMTCHRGTSMPIQTVDLLQMKFEEEGVDNALAYHDQLKEKYFGSHSHDFTETTLLNLAQGMQSKSPQASLKALQKNLKIYSQSTQTMVFLGEYYSAMKEWKTALDYFEQANEIRPNPWLAQKIKGIKEQL